MEVNFKINHGAKTIEELIKDVPEEHKSMVIELFNIVDMLSDDKKSEESELDYEKRTNFIHGVSIGMLIGKSKKEMDELKTSNTIELFDWILKEAYCNKSIIAFIEQASEILNIKIK